MGDTYFRYNCGECGKTVVVASDPRENTPDGVDAPTLCPTHSEVAVDFSLAPESVDGQEVVDVQ